MKSIFKNKSLEKIGAKQQISQIKQIKQQNIQSEKPDKKKLLQFFRIYHGFPQSQIISVYPILFPLLINVQEYKDYVSKGQHYITQTIGNLKQSQKRIYSALAFFCQIFGQIPSLINIVKALLKGNNKIQIQQQCIIFQMSILVIKYVFQGWFEDCPVPSYKLITYLKIQLEYFSKKSIEKLQKKFSNDTNQMIQKFFAGIIQNFFILFSIQELEKILFQILLSKHHRALEFLIVQLFIDYQQQIMKNGKSGVIEGLILKKCKYKKQVANLLNSTRKLIQKYKKQNITQKIIEKQLFKKYSLQDCIRQEIHIPYAAKCTIRNKQQNFEIQLKNRSAQPQIQQNYRKIKQLLKLSQLQLEALNKKTHHLNQLKLNNDNQAKIRHNQQIQKQKKQIQRLSNMLEILNQQKKKPNQIIKLGQQKLPSLQPQLKNLQDQMVFLMTLQKPPISTSLNPLLLPSSKPTARVIAQRQESRFLQQQLLQLSSMKNKIERQRSEILMRQKSSNNVEQFIRIQMLQKQQKKQKLLQKMQQQRCREFKNIINQAQRSTFMNNSKRSNNNSGYSNSLNNEQNSGNYYGNNNEDIDLQIMKLQKEINKKKLKINKMM